MSIPIVISGTTYQLPVQSQSPPWGEVLTAIIQALSQVSNTIVGPNDILTTTFTIPNNVTSVTNVSGLAFDTTQVRSAIIDYSIYRSVTGSDLSECGEMLVTYSSVNGTWELARFAVGDAGVTFTMTNTGQLQFTSTNFAGAAYTSKMVFSAKAFSQ